MLRKDQIYQTAFFCIAHSMCACSVGLQTHVKAALDNAYNTQHVCLLLCCPVLAVG